MNIIRRIVKFFDIVLISLALFIFVLSTIISNFTLNKDYIKKLLRENQVYTEINDEIKNSVKTDLKVSLSEIPNLDINELVDKTITDDLLEKELDFILTTLYDTNKMKVDLNILVDGYVTNLDNYIKDNNINIPEKVRKEIKSTITNNSLEEDDVTYFNENYSKYFGKAKDLVKKIKLYSLISLIVLVGLTLVCAKEKLKGLYIPALLDSVGIFTLGILLKSFIDTQDIKIGDKKLDGVITSVKTSLFDLFNKYAIALFVSAIVLLIISIIYNIVVSIKKKKQDTSLENNKEEITETIEEESIEDKDSEVEENIEEESTESKDEEIEESINDETTDNVEEHIDEVDTDDVKKEDI